MRVFTKALLSAAFLLCVLQGNAQTQVTIGTGTTTQRYPFGSTWGYERSASIYTATEIGQAGIIDSIGWNFTTGRAAISTRIYLKMVSGGTQTATNFNTITQDAVIVYFDSTKSYGTGWQVIKTTRPFLYDGTSNLLVIVEANYGGSGGGTNGAIQYSTATSRHQQWTADGNPPTGNGTVNSNRPNLRLSLSPLPLYNIAIDKILTPVTGCSLGTSDVIIRLRNLGTGNIPSGYKIGAAYTFNNGTPVVDSITLNSGLNAGATINHTFSSNVNLTGISQPQFSFNAGAWYDPYKYDDSVKSYSITNATCITANLISDLESSNDGWTASGLWVRAAINKGALTNPPSGTQGFITDAVNDYPANSAAYLYSPHFSITNLCNASFSWDMRFVTENNWDGLVLEISTDNSTWTKVTSITPAYNNSSTSGPVSPPKFSNTNSSWTNYVADLSAWEGAPYARLRFFFGSDGSGQDDGIAVDNLNLSVHSSYTGLAFTAPDTVITDVLYDTEVKSNGQSLSGLVFSWVLDNSAIVNGKDFSYRFPTAGTYTLKHRVVDVCGNSLDSFSQTIVVINPTLKPAADFIADKYQVAVLEVVSFTNLTENGASDFTWIISPDQVYDPNFGIPMASFDYQGGTNASSKLLEAAFYYTGVYDICLVAENSLGIDTMCKTQYITVGGTSSGGGSDSLMCVGSSSSQRIGRVYDSGGPNGDYGNGEGCAFTINFECYDSLKLNWLGFNTEANFDYLEIYDGDEATGTPLWDINNFPQGLTGALALPNTDFFATSGLVTINFRTDVSVLRSGFALQYEMIGQKAVPVASFEIPDTVCATQAVQFMNTSSQGSKFYWDFANVGIIMSTDENPVYTYASGGAYYTVRLIVENCMGADTLYKDVYVANPGPMAVDFAADKIRGTVNDVFTFTDNTKGCLDGRDWEFDAVNSTVVSGSTSDAQVGVNFTQPGFYTVKLFTYNVTGTDSLVRTNYIEVVDICEPLITNSLADMGISRVAFANMDNSTKGGGAYTDFPEMVADVKHAGTYTLTVERPTTSNQITRKIWIDYNADGDFDDAGELVASEGQARTKTFTEQISIPRSAYVGVVTMRVSTSYRNQVNEPCSNRGFGETQDYRVRITPDLIKPVITMIGPDTIIINRNDSYTEFGATATDDTDGNLTPFIVTNSTVDTANAGTYSVTYNVSDTAGNAAAEVRRIVIVLPDAPVITLFGNNPDTMDVFTSYNDPFADARDFDNIALVITVSDNLDTAKVGRYTRNYSATDANGRTTVVSRTIDVVDRVAPTGILIGDTLTVEVFGSLNDPGITVQDNYCQANQITVTPSQVDLDTLGLQTITYLIEDCFGNTSSITRIVRVVDTQAPLITLKGIDLVNIYRPRQYTDSGYTLDDNYWHNDSITVEVIGTFTDTETPGYYYLQYKATDRSGNVGYSERRYINVMNNIGIEETEGISFSIYPNPTGGRFAISTEALSGNVEVSITDINGKLIQVINTADWTGHLDIDMDNAAPGVYMIRLNNGSFSSTKKVVLNK